MTLNKISYVMSQDPKRLLRSVQQKVLNAPEIIPMESRAKGELLGVHLSADMLRLWTPQITPGKAILSLPAFNASQDESLSQVISLLNTDERERLSRLPRDHQKHVLTHKIDMAQDQPYVIKKKLKENAKELIRQMVGNAIGDAGGPARKPPVSFEERDKGKWDLRGLLDLANAVQKLPIAHLKQLEGLRFIRDDYPNEKLPAGFQPTLFEKMALSAMAGYYSPQEKAVILYDQGQREHLAVINNDLRNSLHTLNATKTNQEIKALQKILNPYLQGLGYPSIGEDGTYGAETRQAVRTVEAGALFQYLDKNFFLNDSQRQTMKQLVGEIRAGRFTGDTGANQLKEALLALRIVPDQAMERLLQEMAQSEAGEAFLSFFLTDLANSFRTTGRVTRSEEVLVHEIGHHIQLGLDNEAFYIEEFAKLSGWYETANNSIADGYLGYAQAGESLEDVYNNLASRGKIDQGDYKHHHHSHFVTDYAHTDPMEDFAESYKTFILEPEKLLELAPDKFFFINALPTIQNRRLGKGVQEKSHYLGEDIKVLTTLALQNKLKTRSVKPEQVNDYIKKTFEQMAGLHQDAARFTLDSDTIHAIYDTHDALLDKIGFSHVATDALQKASAGDQDYQAIRKIYDTTRKLVSRNAYKAYEAQLFFLKLLDPQKAPDLLGKEVWNGMSDELQKYMTDPEFTSMILALGKISGYAYTLNSAMTRDANDKKDYQLASRYFSNLINQPTSLLSMNLFSHSYNSIRSAASYVYNPEERDIEMAVEFFDQLKANPAKALKEFWPRIPQEFKDQLQNDRFIEAVSGSQGRYVPSPELLKSVLRNTVSVVQFRRSLELLDAAPADSKSIL